MTKSDLPSSAKKFQEAAIAAGLDVAIREMAESTRTAEEAAAVCGVTVGQIVKSLVFTGASSGKGYLLLVSGANRVDERRVASEVGEMLERPNAETVRALTGYAIGGIPPLGHATPLATYFDRDLLQYEVIWAAAGTPKAVFHTEPETLRNATRALVIDVK